MKFRTFVGNSYPHISTIFCRFILIFHQMVLIFLRVPVVFTLSSVEYSPIKWKCRSRSTTAWFTQNGWASVVVDSTADFLNGAQLPPFVRVTGNDWCCTKSLLTKRLHAQFVCRCKTIFPLVGSTELKNNVSKMLVVKYQPVIDCLQLSDTMLYPRVFTIHLRQLPLTSSRELYSVDSSNTRWRKMRLFPKCYIFLFSGWK